MARGRPFVVIQGAFVLAYVVAGSHVAYGQTGHDRPGIGLSLPGLHIFGVVTTSPTSLHLGSQGLNTNLPGINAAGLVTTTPAAISLHDKGLNANLPGANVARVVSTSPAAVSLNEKDLSAAGLVISGVITTAPTSINLTDKGIKADIPGLDVAGLARTTKGSIVVNDKGLNLDLPGANVAGVIKTTRGGVSLTDKSLGVSVPGANVAGVISITPSSVSLDRNGLNANLPATNVAGLVMTTPTTVGLTDKGLNATISGATVPGVISTTPTTVGLTDKGASVGLPGLDAAGGTVSTAPTTVGLNDKGATVTGGSVNVGGIKTPSVNINVGGRSLWTLPGGDVINHVSPITQMFAGVGSAEAFASVEQLVNGLAFGNDAPAACMNAGVTTADASALGPLPSADIWAWNASTIGRTAHAGYQVSGGDGAACGSTLPFQTQERASFPGALWDASSAFGFKKGSFHVGFSGGATETDTQIKSSSSLRDAGIAQAGSARLRSWSIGGFSLLTTENWYAGSAVGSAWGNTESQNTVLGSESDYNTSSFVAAGFVGTIVPLTDTMRFDLRGTLSYQRTVGEAHVDSLGLVYGDHTIEAADAVLSGRLFGVFRQGDMTIRPFLQAGLTHHLRYDNQLEIDGVPFTLQEADTSVFAATGVDFELGKTLQLSVGVRHDHSPDYESVTGRIGLTARFD